jgi:hypothetical protein
MTTVKQKYNTQKAGAINRGIDWQFTYETWLEWWGEDIVNRGHKSGQLVMARHKDTGPYHPDNVRKATCNENSSEGNLNIPAPQKACHGSKNGMYGKVSAMKGKKQTKLGLDTIIERANSERNTLVFTNMTCPHCNKTTNVGNAKRWHFNKCKEKLKWHTNIDIDI